ncbi:GrpB family protein [Planococcus sp. N028]|uniref:GrpB family protein n=1 Tax=Planococcus shixiaomingii TaxID=3058393 RepID=A0ABT8N5V3_9BACL|nr:MULTISPECIES: GrpB family protein [unclassified Planococcus (in: firmicutes)]MDN7243242.1 GrpB family protein [Planococcus sp. N028]WKA55185.1 GrpB family protein [Planococcus sp. N022]
MRRVTVTDYNPEWETQFELAAAEIRKVLGEECVAVYHIGSTSVQGLAAKPVIDLMPVVRDIQKIDRFNEEMAKIGFVAKGENGLTGRRYFQKGGDERTHHVHVYQEGNKEIARHLVFCNYLRENPRVAEEYGTLKKKLAKEHPYDIQKYIEGKEPLVIQIEKRAMGEI